MKIKLIYVLTLLLILQSCTHEMKVLKPQELSEVKVWSKTISEYFVDQRSLYKLDVKVSDGVEYINGEWSEQGTYIKAVDATTKVELWKFLVEADTLTFPVFDETRIFFGSSVGMYYALDKKTGSEIWSYKAPKDISNFNIIQKKSILFRDLDGKIYSLDTETGSLNWMFELSSLFGKDYSIYRGPFYNSGVLFYALNRNMMLGVSADSGSELWRVDYTFSDGDEFYFQNGQILTVTNMKYKLVGKDTPREDIYNFQEILTSENMYVTLLCFDIRSGRKLWTNKVSELDEQKYAGQLITKSPPLWSKTTNLRYELSPLFTKQHTFFNDRFMALHGYSPKTGKKDIVIDLLSFHLYRKFYAPTILVGDNIAYFLGASFSGAGADTTNETTVLYALNLDNGKLLWQKPIGNQKEVEFKMEGSSLILVLPSRLIVLNRKNGNETLHVRVPFAYNLTEIQSDTLIITRSASTDTDQDYAFALRWK